jgi:hypothetical protein
LTLNRLGCAAKDIVPRSRRRGVCRGFEHGRPRGLRVLATGAGNDDATPAAKCLRKGPPLTVKRAQASLAVRDRLDVETDKAVVVSSVSPGT